MLPREFDARLIAFSKRTEFEQKEAWNRDILIANELRQLQRMQAKHPSRIKNITLDMLMEKPEKDPQELKKEYEDLCSHIDRVRANGVRRILSKTL